MRVIAPLADIVLDRVPAQHAGSASGVFNTGLQLGNSIGIALIGVIFFGLLGTQSASAAHAVAPQLRAGLTAVHVPAPVVGRVEAQFGACLHARLVASDPTVTPAACQLTPAHGSAGRTSRAAGRREGRAGERRRHRGEARLRRRARADAVVPGGRLPGAAFLLMLGCRAARAPRLGRGVG